MSTALRAAEPWAEHDAATAAAPALSLGTDLGPSAAPSAADLAYAAELLAWSASLDTEPLTFEEWRNWQ